MTRVPLYYSALYTGAIDDRARFPKVRYQQVRAQLEDALAAASLSEAAALVDDPPRASRAELELAHDPDYVDRFLAGRLTDHEIRKIGFRPWKPEFLDRTLTLTGASLRAVRDVLAGSPCAGNLAGGTHHAFRAHGEGYCVFNDLAIGARLAQREGVERVMIVDLDVHQGNGTAAIFDGDPSVFTYSMHGRRNYPWRKQTSDVDVELEDGAGDDDVIAALERTLPEALMSQRPDLLFFQAGVDALSTDALGRLSMTREGMSRRNAIVFDYASYWDIPVVVFMGGGYADPISDSVEAHVDLFVALVERARSETQR